MVQLGLDAIAGVGVRVIRLGLGERVRRARWRVRLGVGPQPLGASALAAAAAHGVEPGGGKTDEGLGGLPRGTGGDRGGGSRIRGRRRGRGRRRCRWRRGPSGGRGIRRRPEGGARVSAPGARGGSAGRLGQALRAGCARRGEGMRKYGGRPGRVRQAFQDARPAGRLPNDWLRPVEPQPVEPTRHGVLCIVYDVRRR